MAVSNSITSFLNFISLLCSILIIASGIWLASKPDNECVHWLRWPIVIVGVAVLLVSLAGFIGSYWNKRKLLAFYLFCMALLIVVLLIFLVLAFVSTRPDGSVTVPGRGYREYRLAGFSSWLRENVVGSGNWGNIRACLAESDMCKKMNGEFITAEQFFGAHISPLQRCYRNSLQYYCPLRATFIRVYYSGLFSLNALEFPSGPHIRPYFLFFYNIGSFSFREREAQTRFQQRIRLGMCSLKTNHNEKQSIWKFSAMVRPTMAQ